MCSSRRIEIRVNSIVREIGKKLWYTEQGQKAERRTEFQKKTTSVQEQIASGVSGIINARALGDGPSGAKQCYKKAQILSGIDLRE